MRTTRLLVIGLMAMSTGLVGLTVAAPPADAQGCAFGNRSPLCDSPGGITGNQDPIEIQVIAPPYSPPVPESLGNAYSGPSSGAGGGGGGGESVVAEAPYKQQVSDARTGRLEGAGCTAFSVSPTVLLTAAHCVYDASTKTTTRPEALRYHVTNGPTGLRVTSVTVSPEWVANPGILGTVAANTGADWAVLTYEPNAGIPFYDIELAQPAYGQRVTTLGATDTPNNGLLLRPDPVPSNYNILESVLGVEKSFATGMKIEPGFSGGPVFNEAGEVIGINSSYTPLLGGLAGVTQHVRITCEIARAAVGYSC